MSKTKRITRQNFDPSKIISIHSFSTTVSPPEHPPPAIPFSFMTVSLEYPEGRCSDRAVCAAGAHGEDGRSPAWLKSAQVNMEAISSSLSVSVSPFTSVK